MNQNLPDQSQFDSTRTIAELQRRIRIGASNFYWIAGLSMVYTLFSLFGATGIFPVGLAMAQIVNGYASGAAKSFSGPAGLIQGIAVLITLGIAGLFALCAYLAVRGRHWTYVTGMALYGVDTLLMLMFSDYAGFAFHLFFLWLLFGGLLAIQKLEKLSPPGGPDLSFPKNIGTP